MLQKDSEGTECYKKTAKEGRDAHVHCGLQLCTRRVQGGASVAVLLIAHALAACEALAELHASEYIVAAPQRAHVVVTPQDDVKHLGDEVNAAEAVAAQADACQLQACGRANVSTTGNQVEHHQNETRADYTSVCLHSGLGG